MFSLSPTERQTLLTELDRLLTQSSLRQRLKGNPEQRQMLQRLRDLLALTPTDPTVPLKAEIAALKAQVAALQTQIATPEPLSTTTIALTDFSDRTHHLLTNLDSSLQLVFTTVSRHLQTYELDLTQGLDRLHNLSTQTEPLLSNLLTQLLQTQTLPAATPIPAALAPEDRITTLGDLLGHLTEAGPVTAPPDLGQTNGGQDFTLQGMADLLDPNPQRPASPAEDMATITLADVADLFNDLPDQS
jgi:hypothetical protein